MQLRPLCSFVFALLLLNACLGQKNELSMNDSPSNPLLCIPENGVCEMPGSNPANTEIVASRPLRIVYFTDPICSSCWGIEPQLRRLKLEYGHLVDIEYHMGGLLPSWEVYNSGGISKPSDVSHHWDEVSQYYDMPIDGDVWLEDPLPSSYPPSIAFKAAQIQDEHKAVDFLRRIREMVFLEKKNITRREHLAAAALQTGLDTTRFMQDIDGVAQEQFQQDLAVARSLGVRGFPTLFLSDSADNQLKVYGVKPYEQFERAILLLFPDAVKKSFDARPAALFAIYPTLTTKEFAVLSGQNTTDAARVLGEFFQKGDIGQYATKNGVLWLGKPAKK